MPYYPLLRRRGVAPTLWPAWGHWGAAVSANPFLGVRFAGGKSGDTVRVVWTDNQGGSGEGETTIR